MIDRDGNAVARTGTSNKIWSGAITAKNLVAMGNNLKSEKTAGDMAAAFEHEAMIEYSFADLGANPLGAAIEVKNGRMALPRGPGLGRDPDPEIVTRYRVP